MEFEKEVENEIKKMEEIVKKIKLKDPVATEVYNLALSYLIDAKHFLEGKDFLRAFEAVIICWAYIDACLHFNFLEVPEEFKDYFTV